MARFGFFRSRDVFMFIPVFFKNFRHDEHRVPAAQPQQEPQGTSSRPISPTPNRKIPYRTIRIQSCLAKQFKNVENAAESENEDNSDDDEEDDEGRGETGRDPRFEQVEQDSDSDSDHVYHKGGKGSSLLLGKIGQGTKSRRTAAPSGDGEDDEGMDGVNGLYPSKKRQPAMYQLKRGVDLDSLEAKVCTRPAARACPIVTTRNAWWR